MAFVTLGNARGKCGRKEHHSIYIGFKGKYENFHLGVAVLNFFG